MKTIVCGAGVNGISCALWLKRAGVDVTLLDKNAPASGTSYGNAGILAASSVIPVTVPGVARKAPFMLFDRKSPLFLRWGYLPKLTPFLGRYLQHSSLEHVKTYAAAMSSLIKDSVSQHEMLAQNCAASAFIEPNDYCFAYDSADAFKTDRWAWELRQSLGYDFEVGSGADFAADEPLYEGSFDTVVRCKNHGKISDPGAYLSSLFDEFIRLGGEFQTAEVTALKTTDNGVTAIETDIGTLEAEKFVFTLGPWAGNIAAQLGLNVPFESEGGYHIELINPSHMPTNPVMVASGKFVVTPMKGRLRLAGIVDFAGLDGPDNEAAIDLLKHSAAKMFPDLTYDRLEVWHGYRPTTANSLPLIGQIASLPNAYVGFGHQHVGLTGGAKTGAVLSKLITSEPTDLDLTAFDPNQYAKSKKQNQLGD